MKHILNNRNFLLLWSSQLVEQIGNGLNLMAMIAWVISFSPDPAVNTLRMSILMAAMGIPIALFGPFAGVIVDKFNKRTILLISSMLRGLFVLVIYFIIGYKNSSAFVFILVFLISIAAQVVMPGRSSYVPLLVRKKHLLQANSISAITAQVLQLTGMAAGGIIVSRIGVANTLIINILTFAISLILLLLIRKKESVLQEKGEQYMKVIKNLIAGFTYIMSSEKIKFYISRISFFMIFAGFFYIAFTGNFLAVVLKENYLQIDTMTALSIVLLFLCGGFFSGVFLINKITERFQEKEIFGFIFFLIGVLIITLFFFRNFYYLLFMITLIGMAAVIFLGLAETSLQNNTENNMRGKIFAAYHIFKDGGLILASALAGVIVPFITHAVMILVIGSAFVLYGAVNMAVLIMMKKT